jgi:hypothetical protein
MVGIRVHVEHNMHTYYRHFPLSINNVVRRPLVLLLCLILTLVEPYENIENLFLEGRRDVGVVREIGGADNPSSRNQHLRFSLRAHRRLIPYKTDKALISEPIFPLRRLRIPLAITTHYGQWPAGAQAIVSSVSLAYNGLLIVYSQ